MDNLFVPAVACRAAIGLREGDTGFLHQGEDRLPDILSFFSKNFVEKSLQGSPLEEGGSLIAETVIDLNKGFRKGRGIKTVY